MYNPRVDPFTKFSLGTSFMLKEKGSEQDENPLLWWKSNEAMFSMLSLLTHTFESVHNYI